VTFTTPIRVLAVALGLSTLSFAAGVAGDLTMIDPPSSGERVVLRIPPELPADTPRAGPLRTAAADAAERPIQVRRAVEIAEPVVSSEKSRGRRAYTTWRAPAERKPKPMAVAAAGERVKSA